MAAEIHPTAVVHPGTVLGEGVKVLEHAVVGKQPTLSPRSTAKRDPLEPAVVGDGTVISTGAIVFAGSTLGAPVIVGDQACVRAAAWPSHAPSAACMTGTSRASVRVSVAICSRSSASLLIVRSSKHI